MLKRGSVPPSLACAPQEGRRLLNQGIRDEIRAATEHLALFIEVGQGQFYRCV
jgi:hypothetical protein